MKNFLSLLCLSVFTIAPLSARAGVLTFTDRASFESSINVTQFTDFESLTNFRQPQPLVIGNASFFSTDDSGLFRTEGFGRPSVYLAAQNDGGIRIDIAPGTNAVGTNIGSLFGFPEFTYTLEDAFGVVASGSFVAANDNSTFLGWTSNVGDLRRLTILSTNTSGTGSFEAIDNFTLGSTPGAPTVPEPASMVILSTGVIGLRFVFRRKNRLSA